MQDSGATKSHKVLKFFIGLVVLFFLAFFFFYIVHFGIKSKEKGGIFGSSALSFTVGLDGGGIAVHKGETGPIDPKEYIGIGGPSLGNKTAPITIVEFADFQCPYSKQAFPAIRRILSKYGDKIYFQYRDFPLVSIHPYSFQLAEAGKCANAQNKFWQLHDRLFLGIEDDVSLQPDIFGMAKTSGLDMEKFGICMNNHETRSDVQKDSEAAIDLGFRGTPTFVVNGFKIEGSIPDSLWEKIISKAL